MSDLLIIFLFPAIFCMAVWLLLSLKSSTSHDHQNKVLADRINALLPQTQCGKCEYDGCLPYAKAIASDDVDINRCPPGGKETINQIAVLLGRDSRPLQSIHGHQERTKVAFIDEDLCIGCVLCIKACPVDAIIGTAKQMHTVIDKDCTGCELCIPPCPVDCISMTAVHLDIKKWVWIKPGTDIELSV